MASLRATGKLKEFYPYFLANKPVEKPSKTYDVIDKYTLKLASRVGGADKATMDQALASAAQAFPAMKIVDTTKPNNTTNLALLKAMTSYERKDILMQLSKEIKANADHLAYALCVEAGKPIRDARVEVVRAGETFEIAAEEAVRTPGEYMQLDISARNKGFSAISRRFPMGPVAMISPFNFPINLAAHKIAPAIAVGCPFVLKPSDRTPVGSLLLGEMLAKVNLPPGAFSILPCDVDVAQHLVAHDSVKVVSFTGSAAVGWAIKQKAFKKKVVLELGGNAACVVDSDIDLSLQHIAQRIIFGAYYQSGQSCISVQRVYIHEKWYSQLKDLLVAETKKLTKGDPMDENTFVGPIISDVEAGRIKKTVDDAVSKGGKVLIGGHQSGPNGILYDPTIIENCPPTSHMYCEEIFGPVMSIEKFSDFKDVCAKVNNSRYGLNAGFFTSNMNKAFYAYNTVDVGTVVINDIPSVRVDSQPYGGVKDSGVGREGLKCAMEDMTELKVMLMRDAGKL